MKNIIKKIKSINPIGFSLYFRKFPSGEKKIDYQSRYIEFKFGAEERILDIGSGGEPFPFATHLVDRFPDQTQHRYNKLDTKNLPFCISDIENLPFKSKMFDFVYTAHVIEHIENPAKACEEIMRVAKKGYIEVPTRMSDIMFNFSRLKHFHKWHITMAGKTLIFVEYDSWEQIDTGDIEYFNMAHSIFPNHVKRTYRKNKNLFTNMYLWEEKINYIIFDKNGKVIESNLK